MKPRSRPGKDLVITSQEDEDFFEGLRHDFSLLTDIIYLDSASMGLSPEPVLQAMLEYERNYRSNVGKNVHRLSGIATQRYHHAHEKVARFIGGSNGELVFTKNATEATEYRGPWNTLAAWGPHYHHGT